MLNLSSSDMVLFENKTSFARFSKGYVYFDDSLVDENSNFVQFYYTEEHDLIVLKFQTSKSHSATNVIARSSAGYRVPILSLFNQFRLTFSDKKCAMLLVQMDNVSHWAIDLRSSTFRNSKLPVNPVKRTMDIPYLKITNSKSLYLNRLLLQGFQYVKLDHISDDVKELTVSRYQTEGMRKITNNLVYLQELSYLNNGDWFHALLVPKNFSADTNTFHFNTTKPCEVITPDYIQFVMELSESMIQNSTIIEKDNNVKILRYDQMKAMISEHIKTLGNKPFSSDIFQDIPSKTTSKVLKNMTDGLLLKSIKMHKRNFYFPVSMSDWN